MNAKFCASLPLTTAAAASLILGERPSARFWFFAVFGTAVVILFTMRDSGGHVSTGDLYMFVVAICTSIGYVYCGRLSQQMRGWEVICWILVLALPVTAPSALWLMPHDVFVISARAWSGLAYVSLFSMFIGYFAWNAGLAMGGVARVSQVQLLQTFITLALAAIVNGERLDPLTVGAAVAVVAIVALGSRARVGSS